ncbi:hypothetical protein [Actibacterium pelagium]|uniref:Uncharacterized protein n=1 Tax=Actibacterium pelagium TaxID=2029103 RepID=A0A917AKR5_9RHOB|nr:hypothetical protein [Actibacterium pelagium]GGE59563.1 hypothetical protein GCM10011517_29040 [Actibacterium pelagium]
MKGIAFLFFLVAALCVTIGMAWGIQMSASGNHTLSAAHAHLNLIGWVTMGLFGVYYHVVPDAAGKMLAKVHFGVAVAGVVIITPGIVQAVTERGETLAKVGSLLTLVSMLIFLFTVVTNRVKA